MDITNLKTPCYVIDEGKIIRNLEIMGGVMQKTGAKILLAQKAFSCYALYPLIGRYLSGTTASSLFEARLGREEMPGGEVHIYSPAYRADEFDDIAGLCGHIVFNSITEWERYRDKALKSGAECGIRINPQYSEIETALYNPCAPGSRMGVTAEQLEKARDRLDGISGLHFHTMCEQNSDTLMRTVTEVDKKFGALLAMDQIRWINFGGGHHITRDDYDIKTLIRAIQYMQDKYGLTVYLEPGEAVALNAGYYITEVMDIFENGMNIAIVDGSAACHMPDVLEMPYRPPLRGSGTPGEKKYLYRLGAPTCLAGDIIGDYSFDEPLKPGDRLIFEDMAIYTMVKNNTFNGINLPDIIILHQNGEAEIHKTFDYKDFKSRL